jgi:hypothetical protein
MNLAEQGMDREAEQEVQDRGRDGDQQPREGDIAAQPLDSAFQP